MDISRPPSGRPTIVVDSQGRAVIGVGDSQLGRPGPLGRERLVFALPLDPGPCLLEQPTIVTGVGPPIGSAPIWVSRMLTARWVEDTRRLAG